jgi:hypothetical protein
VALNNGKVVLAGLNKKAGYGAETSVDLKIYDPETQIILVLTKVHQMMSKNW